MAISVAAVAQSSFLSHLTESTASLDLHCKGLFSRGMRISVTALQPQVAQQQGGRLGDSIPRVLTLSLCSRTIPFPFAPALDRASQALS